MHVAAVFIDDQCGSIVYTGKPGFSGMSSKCSGCVGSPPVQSPKDARRVLFFMERNREGMLWDSMKLHVVD